MASPVLESFCCYFSLNNIDYKNNTTPSDRSVRYAYNILCLVFSIIGVISAVYQLWPRRAYVALRTARETHLFMRQNMIITWLALADLLAVLGVLVRSVVWLTTGGISLHHISPVTMNTTLHTDTQHIFCAVNAGWYQYFYICTYMWTLIFAVDVYLYVHDKNSYWFLYHTVGWFLSLVLVAVALITLYFPSLLNCTRDLAHLLPHYLSSYVPILVVMLGNPLLFKLSAKKVQEGLCSFGLFTDTERTRLRRVQTKFCLLTAAFYICWFPNIINGLVLLLGHYVLVPRGLVLTLWLLMAVLNPLQAFFNALLYRRVSGMFCLTARRLSPDNQPFIQDFTQSLEYTAADSANLLSFNS